MSFLTPRNPLTLPMGEGGDRNGEEAVHYVAKRLGRGRRLRKKPHVTFDTLCALLSQKDDDPYTCLLMRAPQISLSS